MLRVLMRARRGVELVLMLSLFAMVALTFCDVLGRRLFGIPIYGAYDVTEHLMVIVVFSGLPLVTAARGHLTVDLFDRFLNRPGMGWWHGLIALLVAAILLLISYRFLLAAHEAVALKEVSQALYIPRSVMYAFISFTTLLSAIAAVLPSHGGTGDHSGNAL